VRVEGSESTHFLCKILEFSRSGYYQWLDLPESRAQNAQLEEKIITLHQKTKCRYGVNRIYTYIHTKEGFLYLAVWLDIFSRMLVGWSLADHLE